MTDENNELTAMTVSIPGSLKAWVKSHATATGCATPSEFIRRLLHDAQKAAAQSELEQLLLDGLASPSREVTREDWADIRATVLEKVAKRKKSK